MLYIAAIRIFMNIYRVVGRGVSDAVSLFRHSADHHLFSE